MASIRYAYYDAEFLQRFQNTTGFKYGVLLGGLVDGEETLFLPIEVPPKFTSSGDSKDNVEIPKEISEVDEKWLCAHCKNLSRMIPGGVRISGLYFVTSSAFFSHHVNHVKKLLLSLTSHEPLLTQLESDAESQRLVLVYDPYTKRFLCKSFDLKQDKAGFRTVTISQNYVRSSWRAFKTHINLSIETILPADRKKEKILLQLQNAVEPYLQALLTDSMLMIDGDMRAEMDKVLPMQYEPPIPINPAKDRKNKHTKSNKRRSASDAHSEETQKADMVEDSQKSKKEREKSLKEISSEKGLWENVAISVYSPQFPLWQRAGSSSSLESGNSSDTGPASETTDSSNGFLPINRLVIYGHIPGIAFLPHTCTVGQLLQALRKDFVQSILARLQLLTEELHITSGELEVPRMLLPQRVLVRLPACSVLPLSDYKFLSETADDVVTRLNYFCLPLGTQAAEDETFGSSNVDGTMSGSSESSLQSQQLHARIDTSCIDTSFEKAPDGSADDEFSDSEIMDAGTQNSLTNSELRLCWSNYTKFVLVGLLVLLLAVLISFMRFNS